MRGVAGGKVRNPSVSRKRRWLEGPLFYEFLEPLGKQKEEGQKKETGKETKPTHG